MSAEALVVGTLIVAWCVAWTAALYQWGYQNGWLAREEERRARLKHPTRIRRDED